MKTPFEIIDRPIITEKTTDAQKLAWPQYAFRVSLTANKRQIRDAVQTAFNVKVVDVDTMRVKGKVKRVRTRPGKRPDWKKAIVTLEKGGEIKLY